MASLLWLFFQTDEKNIKVYYNYSHTVRPLKIFILTNSGRFNIFQFLFDFLSQPPGSPDDQFLAADKKKIFLEIITAQVYSFLYINFVKLSTVETKFRVHICIRPRTCDIFTQMCAVIKWLQE